MITYIPHLITLVLCVSILVLAGINLRMSYRHVQEDLLMILILMAVGWQVVVILFFMYNQTVWVFQEHDKLVGTVDSALWLMYDYSDKFFHLSSGLILYYYLHDKSLQDSVEETILNRWSCPIAGTSELDKVKARLDKLSQEIIPTIDLTDKGDK